MKISLLLLFAWHNSVRGSYINPYPKLESNNNELREEVAGKPLILTPYIENDNITFARNLARVKLTEDMGVQSYSGYFTVNKKHNSNQFFWYFPPTSAATDAPVILWLQGGPGGSSLFGLFAEHGPIKVENNKFIRRKDHWAVEHHIIYIDNPVGTGFSFTDEDGYAKDEIQVGDELYKSLIQFFKLFPNLKQNKFFIAGESYAGKYVPALGYTIHVNNINSSNDKINLKGLAIGNGLCDPVNQLEYGNYIYQHGLIDLNQLKEIQNNENECKTYIKNSNWEEASDCIDLLLMGVQQLTGINNIYNYINLDGDKDVMEYAKLLVTPAVRKAMHVGDQPYDDGAVVQASLKEDIMKSVAPWITELLKHYDILFYNGQLDIFVAYPLTENFLQKLPYVDAAKYKTAIRHIWRVDGNVAGYVKTAGKLTEILVRNAGHMVPLDKPKWALDLITRFTHGKPFY